MLVATSGTACSGDAATNCSSFCGVAIRQASLQVEGTRWMVVARYLSQICPGSGQVSPLFDECAMPDAQEPKNETGEEPPAASCEILHEESLELQ